MKYGKMLRALGFVLVLPCLACAAEGSKLVYFDQPESARLFDQADVKGQFWRLARYFISQRIDTFCSVASSVMVLNALELPAPAEPAFDPYHTFTQDNVLNAQTELARSQLSEIQETVNYQRAQVQLAFATGTILGASKVIWEPTTIKK